MCKGTRYGQDTFTINKSDMHPTIRHLYTKDYLTVDKCIGEEVKYLLKNGIATLGHSCCGHGEVHAQAIIFPQYQLQAKLLGYTVVKARNPNWEEGRYETFIYLKNGTKNKGLFGEVI